MVALHRKPERLDFLSVMAREITLTGSMAYPDDYAQMVRMLSEVDLGRDHAPLPALALRGGARHRARRERVGQGAHRAVILVTVATAASDAKAADTSRSARGSPASPSCIWFIA